MNEQEIQITTLSWWLITAWVTFSAVTFVLGWSWIVVNARKRKPGSALVRAILLRGIPFAFVHLIWMTAILLSISIEWENLVCLWTGAPIVLGFAYLSLYAGFRRLRHSEEAESQRDILRGQESK